jgi:hypothetical protein
MLLGEKHTSFVEELNILLLLVKKLKSETSKTYLHDKVPWFEALEIRLLFSIWKWYPWLWTE